MSWDTSDRRSRLPKDWAKIRKRILKRDDYRCTWTEMLEGRRVQCSAEATDVDHYIPGDDHSDENLRSLCPPHHKRKTARESGAARAKRRKEIRGRFRRPVEEHPGYVAMKENT